MHSSIGANSTPDQELNRLEEEKFELVDYYLEKAQTKTSKIKKSKSAECGSLMQTDHTADLVNDPLFNEDSSDDEDRKIGEDISDEELDITFDLNDEDFDIFGQRSETIYSVHGDPRVQIKAKDFNLK